MKKPMQHVRMNTIPALFRNSWELMKDRYLSLFLVWLAGTAILLAIAVLFAVIGLLTAGGGIAALTSGSPEALLGSIGFVTIMAFGLMLLLGFFSYIVVVTWGYVAATQAVIAKKKLPFSEVFQKGWKLFFPFLGVVILMQLVVMGGYGLLVFPGIFLAIALLFSGFVFVDEEKRGFAALVRSYDLVRGNWWAVFGRLFLLYIIFAGVVLVLMVMGEIADAQGLFALLTQLLTYFLFTPFAFVFVARMYKDLQAKKKDQPLNLKDRKWKFLALAVYGAVIMLLAIMLPLWGIFVFTQSMTQSVFPSQQIEVQEDSDGYFGTQGELDYEFETNFEGAPGEFVPAEGLE